MATQYAILSDEEVSSLPPNWAQVLQPYMLTNGPTSSAINSGWWVAENTPGFTNSQLALLPNVLIFDDAETTRLWLLENVVANAPSD